MNIKVDKRYSGCDLIIEAENVKIVEDIEVRIYPKDENGKTTINLHPKRDIGDNYMSQIVEVLDQMIYYRKAEYDSSVLIENLFEKLPQSVAESLSKKMYETYKQEEE